VLEALVDIRVERGSPIDLPTLANVHVGEEERYPKREALMSSSITFDPKGNAVAQAAQSMNGYRFSDSANSRIAQVRQDGFTFSRLQPYDQWESWRGEARRVWDRYVEAVRPKTINRVAVRYINRIDVSSTRGRLRDYLNIYPELPNEIPNLMTGFIMRLELALPDLPSAALVLSLGRIPPPSQGLVSILLDLDLYQQLKMGPREENLWDSLETLHARENLFFESCITDRARELFT